MGPVPKVFRPMINRDTLVDPNSSDHVVAITELREQVATLQKQLLSKDHQLLLKEKQVSIYLPTLLFLLGLSINSCKENSVMLMH